MGKMIRSVSLLIAALCLSSCDLILNLGNKATDSYCISFPDPMGDYAGDTSYVQCFNGPGIYETGAFAEYIGYRTSVPGAVKSGPFIEDRQNNGNRVVFEYKPSAEHGYPRYRLHYAYIVPQYMNASWLPAGMDIDSLVAELKGFVSKSMDKTLTSADLENIHQALMESGYPFCGVAEIGEAVVIRHEDVFGK